MLVQSINRVGSKVNPRVTKLLYTIVQRFSSDHAAQVSDKVLYPKDAHFHSPYSIFDGPDGEVIQPAVPRTRIGDIHREVVASAQRNAKDVDELWPQLDEKQKYVFARYFGSLYLGGVPMSNEEKAFNISTAFNHKPGLLRMYTNGIYNATGKLTRLYIFVGTLVSLVCTGYMAYTTIHAIREYFASLVHPHETLLPRGFIYDKDDFFTKLGYHTKELASRDAFARVTDIPEDPADVSRILQALREPHEGATATTTDTHTSS